MIEAEWLACTDWRKMLEFLRGKASDRKLRLFACACCRRIWHLLPHEENRELVAAVEDRPDGTFYDPDLNSAIVASSGRESECGEDGAYWAVKYLGRSYYKIGALDSAVAVALKVARRMGEGVISATELATQAGLLRDVFAHSFRPSPLDPSWLAWNGGTVPKLAQAIYDDRRFSDLPILADALEEAGCTDADILTHCRSEGPHVRGCWVVDLLLGKE
jgi:hypothetical protein